jgi:hypothetical protein
MTDYEITGVDKDSISFRPLPRPLVLGRDDVGLVAECDGIRYYLTECCGASAKGIEGGVGCRSCYRYIDDALGGAAMAPDFPHGPLVEVFGDGITHAEYMARRGPGR